MEARYDAAADFYEAGWPDEYGDPTSIALFSLLGPVDGLRVLDLACGHGRMTREIARRGGETVGVDLSSVLLGKARDSEAKHPLGIRYLHADVASDRLDGLGVFDAVACSFGLSDIDDLDGCLATVAGVLRPGGRFVFSLVHPCFPGGAEVSGSWPSTGTYYDEGFWMPDGPASSLRRRVGANHRMLSTYLTAMDAHDLRVTEAVEPAPPEDWRLRNHDASHLPVFLAASCVRS
jgi:SAM-dependent methyltransferase